MRVRRIWARCRAKSRRRWRNAKIHESGFTAIAVSDAGRGGSAPTTLVSPRAARKSAPPAPSLFASTQQWQRLRDGTIQPPPGGWAVAEREAGCGAGSAAKRSGVGACKTRRRTVKISRLQERGKTATVAYSFYVKGILHKGWRDKKLGIDLVQLCGRAYIKWRSQLKGASRDVARMHTFPARISRRNRPIISQRHQSKKHIQRIVTQARSPCQQRRRVRIE